MSTRHLRNIGLKDYLTFLEYIGCKCNRTTGGHHHYTRKDLNRPITVQSHIDPVPEFIIKQHLRALNMSKKDFLDTFYTM
jgi:predicted RNA binding protein YcfA (HicA-like mRNA interferase family)